MNSSREVDYVIVGGGTAGCVLAHRLSANGRHRVLVLEAGGSAFRPQVLIPGLSTRLMGNPRWDWCYYAEPDPSRNGRVDIWPGGKVLGGGSAINGMVYLRGHRVDYDGWAAAGATGWSYEECLPYFLRCESNSRLGAPWHGQTGPLSVSDLRVDHPLNEKFLAACVAAGLHRNDDVNGAEQEGIGRMQASQRHGLRHSTARGYLAPARRRANLVVITGALVQRLVIAEGRATGVLYAAGGRLCEVKARREIILSAGAIASPKLLLLSGVGPADELRPLGIDVHLDLPGVGHNLQEHPGVIVDFEMKVPTLSAAANSRLKYALAALQYLALRRGPASSPVAHVVGFVKTTPALEAPDVQFHFAPFSWDFVGTRIMLSKTNRVGVAVNVCRPETRGAIRLRSADPAAPPIIDHALFGSRADLEKVIAGGRLVQRIFATSPLREVCDRPLNPPSADASDTAWEAFIRERGFLMYHPVGTCRMGQDALAVVDPRLKVRGIAGLRVVDASVMPTVPAANTNGPTIMVAEKASDLILADA